ncbi:uncharacterized protein LOC110025168 [Phalaenopsis equestris]|uniref:uncharacterized protein LOC110025168 n=1 Tax=Phalaenopsis equestris TaxID=78828 RepID=UPI0009E5675A|nr:uncharacterized protein LOC110025168 [Phalaenopsis equestris]
MATKAEEQRHRWWPKQRSGGKGKRGAARREEAVVGEGLTGQRPVVSEATRCCGLQMGVLRWREAAGGIRNNRRPLEDEEPMQYAERCAVQWHRVCIYPERLGRIALNHVKPGSLLYLEGNLESKVFSDPITGLVRRIREVAIRHGGMLFASLFQTI